MNTVSNRLNAIFGYGSAVLFIVLVTNGISSFFIPVNPRVDLKLGSIQQTGTFAHNDVAAITFDLDADLSSLFHWNTKMLFVWVTASYSTPDRPINQVTKEESIINLQHQTREYDLIDKGKGMLGQQVNLTFSWNRIPVTGLLLTESLGHHTFMLNK
ncbi:microsomal signal peptidase subunit [Planoprotostelium fungivorum]|uniref:Signal peptidase complex subunit 3 n=1 Tax=Planoprotostelium fungivorum TaxID=1890364 RepID=A0A2P6NG20_9EUKA|nr:microsomal signal peptidase subunit [Planoprotostelium fungivorum]